MTCQRGHKRLPIQLAPDLNRGGSASDLRKGCVNGGRVAVRWSIGLRIIVNAFLLFASFAFPISSFGSGSSLAIKTTGNEQINNSCDRLLAATLDITTTVGRDQALSGEVLKFLALIEIGMGNLGPELSRLLSNLGQVARAKAPINPFLNLGSTLGLALSTRAEPLVQDLEGEWKTVASIIAQRVKAGVEEQSQRQTDEDGTRGFSAFVDVVIPADVRPPDLEKLYYIGETPQAIIFGTNAGRSPAGIEAQGRIFRVSKSTHEVRMIYQVQMPDWRAPYVMTQWMRQGLVYGFGHPNSPIPRKINDEPQIFRLDPETQQIDWAEKWVHPYRHPEPYRFAYRVDVGNSIVGIESITPSRAIGEVYLFDYIRLQFVPTGLVFDETKHPLFSGWWSKSLNEGRRDLKEYISIGRFFKTDGRTLAEKGDSAEWKNWSAFEAVKSERNPDPKSGDEFLLHEADSPKPRPAIPFMAVFYPSETILSVEDGKGILYLAAEDGTMSPTLLLIDRDSWTATDAVVVGGPPRDTDAKWKLDRNQTGDVFLRMDLSHEVAIWKFDPLSKQFELQLHQTIEGADADSAAMALIDLENFKLIAWVYSDLRLEQGLKVWRPVKLEREHSSSEGKKQ